MKALGLAVGLFAVVAGLAGRQTGDEVLYMLAVASLICAATTWLSADISRHLQIFVAIFSAETIIFGLVVTVAKLGLWPESLKEYSPTDKLPLTVAIFSIPVSYTHLDVYKRQL